MQSRLLPVITLVTATMITSACTQRVADFTLLSTKNVDLSRAHEYVRGTNRVEGRDEEAVILIFSTGIPDVKSAVDRAIESTPGAIALTDGVIHTEFFYIPLLGGSSAYIVEGTPLIDPSISQPARSITPSLPPDSQGNDVSKPLRTNRRF